MGGSSATHGLFIFYLKKGQDINPWPFLFLQVLKTVSFEADQKG
jgi:hypothetical protein